MGDFRFLILHGAGGGLWWTSVLNLALPPQRHRPDAHSEHQDPVIHMEKEKKGKNIYIYIVAPKVHHLNLG